jgi:hypothetical protein
MTATTIPTRTTLPHRRPRVMSRVAIGIAAGAVLVSAYSGTVVVAEPPNTGCRIGNPSHELEARLFNVAELLALGYRAPGVIDDPANGGNGDGFICGIADGNFTTPFGGQLYFWQDNQFFPGPG